MHKISSTYHEITETSGSSNPTTGNDLLEHLLSLADELHPREIIRIEKDKIVQLDLDIGDIHFKETVRPDLAEFQYEDLRGDEFRLLKLSLSRGGSLEFELETFNISSAPPYDALSYKWEPESELRKSSVICNGCRFMLSPNLYAALYRNHLLQSLVGDAVEPTRYVWNDFTCINQRDVKEREVQVPKMANIYAGAQSTIVWLGHAHGLSDLALLSVPKVIERLSKQEGLLHGSKFETAGVNSMTIWDAFGEFFHRPWFQRLWVLQEVVLARSITIVCGNITVDWTILTTLVNSIINTGLFRIASGQHDSDEEKGIKNGLVTVGDINRLRWIRESGEIMFIPELMGVAWGRQCLEQVDRVWAITGILPDVLRRNLFAQDFVDYSEDGRKNYEKTFVKVSKWLAAIDLPGLLLLTAQSEKSSSLPTWCPDWCVMPKCSNLGKHFSYKPQINPNEDQPKSDELPIRPHITWSWDHNILSVAGYRVDIIVDFTDDVYVKFKSTVDEEKQNASDILRWQIQALKVAQKTLQDGEKCFQLLPDHSELIPDRYWEAVIAGIKKFGYRPTSSYGNVGVDPSTTELTRDDYLAWFEYLLRVVSDDDIDNMDITIFERAMYFATSTDSICAGRKLASTVHGRLAIVPPDVEQGDVICMFYGCYIPYVVRASRGETSCRFIGDAYVEGIMHSESLSFTVNAAGPLHKNEKGPDELISLL